MKKLLIFIALWFCVAGNAYASVIFSDTFDSQPTLYIGGSDPSGWSWQCSDGCPPVSATEGGVTHYAAEITEPGRGGSGKDYKAWRYEDNFRGYTGMYRYISSSATDIWFRFYVKIPVAWDVTVAEYQKWFRLNVAGGEIYCNLNGSRASGSLVQSYDGVTFISAGNMASTIWDGNWHCLQFHYGLNSSTLQLYIDGNLYYNNTSFNWGSRANTSPTLLQHFGLGNAGSTNVYQSSWQAIEFDDVIMATTKAETDPDGGSDTTAPTVSISTSDPSSTTSDSFSVTGTASDAVGVTEVT